MPLIPYPAVPDLPGVPQLPRLSGSAALTVGPISVGASLLTGDDPAVAGLVAEPQWGIFDRDGNAVVSFDSVIGFEHRKEYRVADFPVEAPKDKPGTFASFNKVEVPFDERITFARGGSDADRADILSTMDQLVAALDLFDVFTPEYVYSNANIVAFDYRRTARNGVSLLLVEVVLRQIRVAPDTQFSNTAEPAGAASQNGGAVQPQTPSPSQTAAAAGGAN